MDLIQDIINRAKANPQHIVFPEGTEERTLKAADRLLAEGVVRLTLIGDPSAIRSHAQELGLHNIDKANLLDPKNHGKEAGLHRPSAGSPPHEGAYRRAGRCARRRSSIPRLSADQGRGC